MEGIQRIHIREGDIYNVKVVKILTKGIIVLIEDSGTTEFIHISKIADSFISDINDFVSVGDELTAMGIKSIDDKRVTENNGELSLHHLHLKPKNNISYVDTELITDIAKEKNLDDMIAAADQCLKEKMKAMHSKNNGSHKRNHRK
ncbi:MAG: S1 RNA-binding domain-containing protein [Clostridium sp.]|nr:S1 RNA-binding domain-containing protein [Clostridium sp.]